MEQQLGIDCILQFSKSLLVGARDGRFAFGRVDARRRRLCTCETRILEIIARRRCCCLSRGRGRAHVVCPSGVIVLLVLLSHVRNGREGRAKQLGTRCWDGGVRGVLLDGRWTWWKPRGRGVGRLACGGGVLSLRLLPRRRGRLHGAASRCRCALAGAAGWGGVW